MSTIDLLCSISQTNQCVFIDQVYTQIRANILSSHFTISHRSTRSTNLHQERTSVYIQLHTVKLPQSQLERARMAPRATTKVQWTVEEKRRLLDYIRNCKAKNQKATSVDFVQNVINSLDKAQAARSTMQIVREETSAMVKNAKLDEKHSSTTLWKSGPEILDLNHPYLRGVYTAKVIAEISDAAQAGPSNARKRKPEESMDGQRKSKRNRNGLLTEI